MRSLLIGMTILSLLLFSCEVGDSATETHLFTLEANGGSFPELEGNPSTHSFTIPHLESVSWDNFPIPEREGFNFSGWYILGPEYIIDGESIIHYQPVYLIQDQHPPHIYARWDSTYHAGWGNVYHIQFPKEDNPSEVYLESTVSLQPRIFSMNGENTHLRWESSDPLVATVDQNGSVTPIEIGDFTISAHSTDGSNIMATWNMSVKYPRDWFVTQWSMGVDGTETNLEIPFSNSSFYECLIDWGDGSPEELYQGRGDFIGHQYSELGTYRVIIEYAGGTDGGFGFGQYQEHGDKVNLISILQWGNYDVELYGGTFMDCTNLTSISAEDAPSLWPDNQSASGMFHGCESLGLGPVNLSHWDTSSINNMSGMFKGCSSFNSDISDWDVSNVSDFTDMFTQSGLVGQEPQWYLQWLAANPAVPHP